jgi:predicted RNA-binding Zn ribbon-like protein
MEFMEYLNRLGKFDLDAEVLCLNFANTMDWHASDHPEEGLNNYVDLLLWGIDAGIISTEEAEHLFHLTQAHPDGADYWHSEAIILREAIYRIFVAIADPEGRKQVAQADLDILTRFWRQAAQSRQMVDVDGELKWEWNIQAEDLGRVLWPVTQSAVDLLSSDQRDRVGQCGDDRGCGFLFLDTSRNHSRRWCSMDSCGNRAKASRHYSRTKS